MALPEIDYESEYALQQNMHGICKGRTVIIIAHWLSTVRHANRIVVMDGGRIVESGSHDALIGQRGIYARLHALQSGSLRPATATENQAREPA